MLIFWRISASNVLDVFLYKNILFSSQSELIHRLPYKFYESVFTYTWQGPDCRVLFIKVGVLQKTRAVHEYLSFNYPKIMPSSVPQASEVIN